MKQQKDYFDEDEEYSSDNNEDIAKKCNNSRTDSKFENSNSG